MMPTVPKTIPEGVFRRRCPALVTSIIDELLAAAAPAAEHGGSGLEEFLRVLGRSFAAHRGYTRMLVGNTSAASGADKLRSKIAQLLGHARNSGDMGPR